MNAALRLLLIVLAVGVLAAGGYYLYDRFARAPARGEAPREVTAGAPTFEIADTPERQQRGLGGRTSIPDDYGMLFVFATPARYGIWMKDMLVPIDIIWLADDGSILHINHEVSPSTYPEVLYPPQPVRYVLETRAGYALDHGWDVGTNVPLPKL